MFITERQAWFWFPENFFAFAFHYTSVNNRRQFNNNDIRRNSFCQLVQKFLVGNNEPIIGICGKIFTINLHNLEMLFMLWIKYKFSECPAFLRKHEGPNGRLSGDGSARARRHGGHSGAVTPISCCALPNFVVLRKICFKHMIKTKIFPLKNVFFPPNLRT